MITHIGLPKITTIPDRLSNIDLTGHLVPNEWERRRMHVVTDG